MISKLIKYIVLNIKDRTILKRFSLLRRLQYESKSYLEQRQLSSLNRLLTHAVDNVPYYRRIFGDAGLLKDGSVKLASIEEITKIPLLDKDTLVQNMSELSSSDHASRGSFINTSGGSTGKPVKFIQDRDYVISNLAHAYLVKSWRGCGPYDSTIVLWGAERDTFEGRKPFKQRIKDLLTNTNKLNTFSMSADVISRYIGILNAAKPKLVFGYTHSIYEIAKYAREHNLQVQPQNAVHAAAGTVHDFMRAEIEAVFGCPVFNFYGSRDIGAIASECSAHDGLHVLGEHTLVEVIDSDGRPCKPGEMGQVVVTTLQNYSMPLIRYQIGDLAEWRIDSGCSCGCNYPKLSKIMGRTTDVFRTKDGTVVMPEFFIHLLGVVANKGEIVQFQVVQCELDRLLVKIVRNSSMPSPNLDKISGKIKTVMGTSCVVDYEFVDDIPKTPTGKYLYTISKL